LERQTSAADRGIVSRLFLRLLDLLPARLYAALERLAGRRPLSFLVRRTVWRMRKTAEIATIKHGPAAGLQIRSAGPLSVPLGRLEPFVQESLVESLRPGGVLYDIGANAGFMTLLGSRLVGEQGSVVAFEPLAENVALLEENLRLNGIENVLVLAVAASARSGKAQMLLPDDLTGASLVDHTGQVEIRERRQVETLRIDEAVSDGRLPEPTVVKIDVEGAELEVLDGLKETLGRARPVVICEAHGLEREAEAALKALGYRIARRWHDRGRPGWNAHLLAVPGSDEKRREPASGR
jgi:FkbM family methyltransferase